MKLTTVVSVRGETQALLEMMERFNAACNWLSGIAFSEGIFSWLSLQRRAYYELRERYGLTSAQTIVAIRKVAFSYSNKRRQRSKAIYHPRGGVPLYRQSYRPNGTIKIYGVVADYQAPPMTILKRNMPQAVLLLRDGRFLIHQIINIEAADVISIESFLGCDFGIINIAADSDGEVHSGAMINGLRHRYARLRAKLQAKQTRSAKRRLRKRRGKEKGFARDVNHCISKKIVAKAKGTGRGIALENLSGIRDRATVGKAHRRQHHSWAFFRLRTFIEYKAALAGVPVVLVDPRNTSRTCPGCGHIDKKNRKSQAKFLCVSCGLGGPADTIAAVNIGRRALGDAPYAAASASCEGESPIVDR